MVSGTSTKPKRATAAESANSTVPAALNSNVGTYNQVLIGKRLQTRSWEIKKMTRLKG